MGRRDDFLGAIEKIHAAGLEPALWPAALGAVTRLIGGTARHWKDATVAGATVGIAWHPASWQFANLPVSLFAEYQHSWWDEARFNAPSASPAFSYAFRRQDDVVKFGVNFPIPQGAAPPPAPPAYPVKALRAK